MITVITNVIIFVLNITNCYNGFMETSVGERIKEIVSFSGLSVRAFANRVGLNQPTLHNYINGRDPSINTLMKICDVYDDINPIWLLTGDGKMMKTKEEKKIGLIHVEHTEDSNLHKNMLNKNKLNVNRKQIPLYDDVASIGGQHEMTSDMIGTTNPSDYIDAGDWFREATVAIRHYGKSMTEYPSGCILALKEVNDRRLLIPGRDYVIETDEYRVTKKIQVMDTYIRAHSTNTDKYDDGTLIYQPFDVPMEAIRRMFIVLGYVVKKNGGTLLYNK